MLQLVKVLWDADDIKIVIKSLKICGFSKDLHGADDMLYKECVCEVSNNVCICNDNEFSGFEDNPDKY